MASAVLCHLQPSLANAGHSPEAQVFCLIQLLYIFSFNWRQKWIICVLKRTYNKPQSLQRTEEEFWLFFDFLSASQRLKGGSRSFLALRCLFEWKWSLRACQRLNTISKFLPAQETRDSLEDKLISRLVLLDQTWNSFNHLSGCFNNCNLMSSSVLHFTPTAPTVPCQQQVQMQQELQCTQDKS